MPQVFISYSRKDSAFIDRLVADLQTAGLTIWYDLSGLDGGTQWETEIQSAIEKSQFFLAVLSPNSLESKWVVREFLYAEKRGIKIIPVQYLPCELPMRMLDLQWIDLQEDNYKRNFDRLLKALDVPTRVDTLAKIKGEEKTQAAILANEKLEAEEKGRIAQREKERQEKDEEEKRKQAERDEIEAGKKAQMDAEASLRLARLEKEKQEKAEAQQRRQDEKKKSRAEVRLRRMSAWQKWKPKLPRLAGLAGFGILIVAAAWLVAGLIHGFGTNLEPTVTPAPSLELIPGHDWLRPADGARMIYVPVGNFLMGGYTEDELLNCKKKFKDCDANWFANQEPSHSVNVNDYWIDQTEVTNAMYRKCVVEGSCRNTGYIMSSKNQYYYSDTSFNEYPVIYTTWQDASDYCTWAGARLPSEAEWEKAARGGSQTIYPWGNDPPNNNLTNFGDIYGDTTQVGLFPQGKSTWGNLDMAGNVMEWVNDWFDENYYSQSPDKNPAGPATGIDKVLRGGSWGPDTYLIASTSRYYLSPDTRQPNIGFRCARSLIETPSPTPTKTILTSTQSPPMITPPPTATAIPAWVLEFSNPILNAISDQTPFIQDDFSKIDPMWVNLSIFNPGVDCSNSKVGIFSGKLQFTADSECNAWAELSSNFNPNNFVVQVEMDLKQLDRFGTSSIVIGNYDIFSLWGDGSWEIVDCDSESYCFASHRGKLKLNTAEPVTITYISFDIRNAVYVNNVPLYYFVHKEPVTYERFMMGIGGEVNVLINNSAEFDNFKLWDLDKIKDLASLLQ